MSLSADGGGCAHPRPSPLASPRPAQQSAQQPATPRGARLPPLRDGHALPAALTENRRRLSIGLAWPTNKEMGADTIFLSPGRKGLHGREAELLTSRGQEKNSEGDAPPWTRSFREQSRVDATREAQLSWRLHTVVNDGCPFQVRTALKNGAVRVDMAQFGGLTPLHRAAFNGNVIVCQELIRNRASANVKDGIGQTPLHLAATHLRSAVVQELLQSNSQADAADREGVTPARCAISRCHEGIRDRFDSRECANCLDHLTFMYDKEADVLQTQLDSLLDVEFPVTLGSMALTPPSSAGHDGSIDDSARRWTKTRECIVSFAHAAGSDSADASPRSQLSQPVVAHRRSFHTQKSKIKKETKIEMGGAEFGYTWTSRLQMNAGISSLHAENARDAVENGRSEECTKPSLIKAVQTGDMRLIRDAIQKGGSLDEEDKFGQTPLHVAVVHARVAVVQYLLSVSADPIAITNKGQSPLRFLAFRLAKTDELGEVSNFALVIELLLHAQEEHLRKLRRDIFLHTQKATAKR